MNATTACPDLAGLREYLLGRMSEAPAAAVEAHLAACTECRKLLPTIQAEDDLVADFRTLAGTLEPAGALMDRLAGNLRDRLLPPDAATPPNTDSMTAATLPPPESAQEKGLSLAPPQQPDEIGRLGSYRILKELGRGGMGVVYLAEDVRLKRRVALKAMLPGLAGNPNSGQRFLREAQAMAAVEHDHIVRIYQVDEDRGVPFLAMEFLKGEPLDERLKREGRDEVASPLPLAEALRIGREIADGLAAAHANGLIHRDIKPGNVWLEAPHGRVKILDFGLARAATQDSALTQQGAIVGTPAYMAPEQARGETVDGRCDLFSLGVVLYRLTTGRQPFRGNDSISTLVSVAMDAPPSPLQINPELPRELSDMVMKLMEKDPARRFAPAGEVVQALRALERKLAREKEAAEQTVALAAAPPMRRRRRLPWVLAAVAALVLLGLAGALVAVATGLIRIQTPQGDYVIDTDDPDFFFQVHDGAVNLKDGKNNKTYTLQVVKEDKGAGEFEVEVSDGGDLAFRTKKFTIRRGEKAALTAWFEPKGVAANPQPAKVDDAFMQKVAALAADQQVEAVAAELKARNPGFDGKVTPTIENGVVVGLQFVTDEVTDIAPVRALPGLRTLIIHGSGIWWEKRNGKLADLSPLRDMKLTHLNCGGTPVADLSSLKDLKLTHLDCGGTPVSDLSPLRDMKLTELWCGNTLVSDLTPLKDMKLTYLNCGLTRVSDLTPLKDMKLTSFDCPQTPASDLSPLKDMKLITLDCSGTRVSDLSPLKEMKLTKLWCQYTQVSDLSPLKDMKLNILDLMRTSVSDLSLLKGMPLNELTCDFDPKRDAEILRSIPTLETINGKPAAEFWKDAAVATKHPVDDAFMRKVAALAADKQVEAVAAELRARNPGFDGKVAPTIEGGVVVGLEFVTDEVTDISPVRALAGLRTLKCYGSGAGKGRLADLSPLKDMKLTTLDCNSTQISDLSPLRGMPLTWLACGGTKVSDLSPLKGMPLAMLFCGVSPVSDLSPLKYMDLMILNCSYSRVTDLSPLKGMKLKNLGFRETKVSDLSPLKGMALEYVGCDGTLVSDLAPLKDAPLKYISCDFKPDRDAEILRSIKTLEKINDKPAAEFWKDVDAKKSVDGTWVKQVAALPADKQVDAVAAKLRELNPGFDGKVKPTIENGVITRLEFLTDDVTDLSPVRALTGLKELWCRASDRRKCRLSDLSPLKGMPLASLDCGDTRVSDLMPLKDMKLMELNCGGTQVSDLSPLEGMPLTKLHCTYTNVTDLTPLKDAKLTELWCGHTGVSDLSPLRGMPLIMLGCAMTRVSDLSPLKDMKLIILQCQETKVADLSLLKDMPLNEIRCDFDPRRDAEVLRSIPTLATINDKPAAEFWKDVDAAAKHPVDDAFMQKVAALAADKQVEAVAAELRARNPGFDGKVTPTIESGVVTGLNFRAFKVKDISPLRALTGLQALGCGGWGEISPVSDLSPLKDLKLIKLTIPFSQVSDLSPLKDMKLTLLDCGITPVFDLSPLKGMPLTELNCHTTKVADLSPLKGMPLTNLGCSSTPVADLSPLTGMKLKELWVGSTQVSDLSPLKDMPLTILGCAGTKVADLSPLKGRPLRQLEFDYKPERDAAILRSIPTLETINDKPAAEFWKDAGATAHPPVDDAFMRKVAALAADKQVEAVAAELKARNPGFDGKVTPAVENGVVVGLEFVTDEVTDIAPVRALAGLRTLKCGGSKEGKGRLADLSPLKGMPLTVLTCQWTPVSDLSPLKDMKLTDLYCDGTKASDLSPLRDMKLTALSVIGTPVSDLSPLKDAPLTYLDCDDTKASDLSPLRDMKLTALSVIGTPVSDLSPLKGMPLTNLNIGGTRVSDLSPLKGMPLTDLRCGGTQFSDLTPLKGMPLTVLYFDGTKVSDLSPLKGMPLKDIICDFKPERDAEILRSLKTLEKINDKPAEEFWKDADAKKP